jgi:hypothetical protein
VGILDRLRSFLTPAPSLAESFSTAVRADVSASAGLKLEQKFSIAFGAWLASTVGDKELLKAYGSDPWLTPVVVRRAESFSRVAASDFRVYKPKGTLRARDVARAGRELAQSRGIEHPSLADAHRALVVAEQLEEIDEDPILDLLRDPMPGVDGFQFWEAWSAYFDLLGESIATKERIGGDVPRYLNLLNPTQLISRPAPGQLFFEATTYKGVEKISVDDAIWNRRLNLTNMFSERGIGLGRSLQTELATDGAMSDMARARYKNHAIPPLILGLLGANEMAAAPGPEVVKQFALDWENKHRGPEKAGSIHVLGGRFVAQQLGHSLQESQYVAGREFNRNTTMQGFGSPPEVHGVLDNANRSTIDAALTYFAVLSTVPMLDRTTCLLQARLMPDFGGNRVLGYVSPVPADREFSKGILVAVPQIFRKNEARALANLPPVSKEEGGEEFLTGPASVPAGDKPKNTDPENPVKPEPSDKKKKEKANGTADA